MYDYAFMVKRLGQPPRPKSNVVFPPRGVDDHHLFLVKG